MWTRRHLLSFALWAVLAAPPARAASYEPEPGAEGELDLEAQEEDGRLLEEELAALLEREAARVDLETATRAELYGLPGLTYARVDALLREREAGGTVEGALSPEELRRLALYLRHHGEASGALRWVTAYGVGDGLPPPMVLRARVEGVEGFRGAVTASLTRRRLGEVRAATRAGALMAEAPGTALVLPKLYVQWTGARASVLVGTYRLGFGQRLTLDTTSQPTPDGFLADDGVHAKTGAERRCQFAEGCAEEGDVTPDFRWTEGFRGAVGTVRVPLEDGASLSLTGFGSYQSRALSQYELFDAAACRQGKTCRAPDVWLAQEGRAEGVRFMSRTLPDVVRELAGGGHAALAFSSRAHVGLTGWMARPAWAVEGMTLDFQPSSRYPAGGAFGAFGLDGAWGAGPVDLFAEVAHSVDATPGGGGGLGAVQRTVLGDEAQELELTLRYYGRDFANPYSGAVSGPDEYEGLRVRNELGARLRYVYRDREAWRLRGDVDMWTLPSDGAVPGSAGTANLRTSARVDYVGWERFQPSLWVEHRDKDLARNGRGQCFEGSSAQPCAGEQYRVAARVRVAVADALAVAVQYQHTWVDSQRLADSFQQDGRAVLDVLYRPGPSLRVRGRVSWNDEDLSDASRPAQALRTTLDVDWAAREGLSARARYELGLDLKDLPRHQFRLELESHF